MARHATVAWTDDWREDASRRDFTINAMSMTPDGALHDYFGGRADLLAGRVRFVGSAADRVREDYLRILRFFRFQARYGLGEPDAEAVAAIRDGVPGLARLSTERVWSELKRILVIPEIGSTVRLMAATGVLPAILPELHSEAVTVTLPPEPLLRLAALSRAPADTLAETFRFSTAERGMLTALRSAPVLNPAASDDDLRRALADWPASALVGAARLAGQDGAALVERLAPLHAQFPLVGRDIVALGVSPGPQVGALLREVRLWVARWRRQGRWCCVPRRARSACGGFDHGLIHARRWTPRPVSPHRRMCAGRCAGCGGKRCATTGACSG